MAKVAISNRFGFKKVEKVHFPCKKDIKCLILPRNLPRRGVFYNIEGKLRSVMLV